jgi:hypothetical protein
VYNFVYEYYIVFKIITLKYILIFIIFILFLYLIFFLNKTECFAVGDDTCYTKSTDCTEFDKEEACTSTDNGATSI